jgi:hypothetical protein
MQWIGAIELVGGMLGIAGSIVLAIPAALDLKNRQFWDRLGQLKSIKGVTADDVQALQRLILDDVLGGYRLHAWCTMGGGALLAVGFGLIAAAGGVRVSGG